MYDIKPCVLYLKGANLEFHTSMKDKWFIFACFSHEAIIYYEPFRILFWCFIYFLILAVLITVHFLYIKTAALSELHNSVRQNYSCLATTSGL